MGDCARSVTELEEVGEGSRKGGFRSLSVYGRVVWGARWPLGGV